MSEKPSYFEHHIILESGDAGALRYAARQYSPPSNLIDGNKIGSSRKDKLKKISSIGEVEAYEYVHSNATYFPNYTKVYIPFIPYPVLKDNLERHEPKKKQSNENRTEEQKSEDIRRAIRKAKNKVIEYGECNFFELFATFTFKADRHDFERTRAKMANWLKLQRRRKGDFEYLVVPEFHKDGALHFHALIKNYKGKLVKSINEKTGKQLIKKGVKYYRFASYTLGFNNVKKIENTPESHSRVISYISKYISKDIKESLEYKRERPLNRYWASKGLKTAIHENNPEEFFADMEPLVEPYTSEFGITYRFPFIHPKYKEDDNNEA